MLPDFQLLWPPREMCPPRTTLPSVLLAQTIGSLPILVVFPLRRVHADLNYPRVLVALAHCLRPIFCIPFGGLAESGDHANLISRFIVEVIGHAFAIHFFSYRVEKFPRFLAHKIRDERLSDEF